MRKCINLSDKRDTKNITTLQRTPLGIHEEHNICEELTMIITKMRQFFKLRINKCYIASRKEGRNQLLNYELLFLRNDPKDT